MKFIEFLDEALHHTDFIETIDLESAKSILLDKCKGQDFSKPLWRGMRDKGPELLLHGKKVSRDSKDGNNIHTLMFDQTFKQNMLPLRSKSIIVYSNKGKPYAKGYGKLYAIFPYNSANIGVCKTNDILNERNTKYDISIEDMNYSIGALLNTDKKFTSLAELKEEISKLKNVDNARGLARDIIDVVGADVFNSGDTNLIYNTIVDLYNPKYFNFKRTFISGYKDTTPTGQELWFSDTCVAIRVDTWEKLVEEGFKL